MVAVARKGERIRAKPGDITMQAGDILLLDTGAAFAQQNKVGVVVGVGVVGGGGGALGGQAGAVCCRSSHQIWRMARPAPGMLVPHCVPLATHCPACPSPLHASPSTPVQDSKHFSIIIEMPDTNPPRYLHTAIAIFSIATAFILYATEVRWGGRGRGCCGVWKVRNW